jgi:hypothetical protein
MDSFSPRAPSRPTWTTRLNLLELSKNLCQNFMTMTIANAPQNCMFSIFRHLRQIPVFKKDRTLVKPKKKPPPNGGRLDV